MKRFFLFFILCMHTFLWAQDDSLEVMIHQVILGSNDLDIEDPEQTFLEISQNLEQSLKGNWTNAGFSIKLSTMEQAEIAQLREQSIEEGSDLLCYAFILVQPRRALIQFSLYDNATGQIIGNSQNFGRWNRITFYNVLEESFQQLWDSMDQDHISMMMKDPDYKDRQRPARILLTPHTSNVDVFFRGEEYLATVEDSPLELPFHPYPQGQEIQLTLKKEGYYTVEEVFILDQSLVEVKLPPMIPSTERALIFRSNYYQIYGIGAGYRYYLSPDRWFINAADYVFFTPSMDENYPPGVHTDLNVEIGYYPFFSQSYHMFRYGLVVGGGCIFTIAGPEQTFFIDPYINWLTLFAEWNMTRFSLAMRLENRYMIGGQRSLLPRGTAEIKIPKDTSSQDDDPYTKLPLVGLELIWKL